jgi:outer membrane protein OmpA-like peptidoglycan-associated protein
MSPLALLLGLLGALTSPCQASGFRPTPALQETGPTITLVAPSLESPGSQQLSAWVLSGPNDTQIAGGLSWTPTRRARLHVVTVFTTSPVIDGTDLTVGSTLALLQAPSNGLDLALVPEITWNPRLGKVQSIEGRLALAAGGRTPTLGWTFSAAGVANTGQDAWAEAALALRARVFAGSWWVGELRGGFDLVGDTQGLRPIDGALGVTVRGSDRASALFFVESQLDPITLDWRLGIGLGVRARHAGLPPDVDRDHVPNRSDQCTRTPEDIDSYQDLDGCPDLDDDLDGIPDAQDLCPRQAEDIDGVSDADGCPDPDNDLDGLPDDQDMCPNQPGRPDQLGCPDGDRDTVIDAIDMCPDREGTPGAQGCPDQDDDGVPDPRDQCPNEPAGQNIIQAVSNGCPSVIYIGGAQALLPEHIPLFEPGSTALNPLAEPGLRELAKLLRARPSLHLIILPAPGELGAEQARAVRQALIETGLLPPGQVGLSGTEQDAPPWADPTVDLLLLPLSP